jgi:hypothetical protein
MKAFTDTVVRLMFAAIVMCASSGCTVWGYIAGAGLDKLPPTCTELSSSLDSEVVIKLKSGGQIEGLLLPANIGPLDNGPAFRSAVLGANNLPMTCTSVVVQTRVEAVSVLTRDIKSFSRRNKVGGATTGVLVGLTLDILAYQLFWKDWDPMTGSMGGWGVQF